MPPKHNNSQGNAHNNQNQQAKRKFYGKRRSKNKTMVLINGSAPVANSTRSKTGSPSIMSNGRTCVVSHTEYIADISSTSANFFCNEYPINPGLNRSFPWLSGVATNYESYLFRRLEYSYRPLCPTSTQGTVVLAIDYDAADPKPTSKVQVNSFQETVTTVPWNKITHHSKPQNLRKFGVQRYVRTGANPANSDIKTYDIGNLFVCTSNTPSTTTTLGEIWVSYTVELLTPQLSLATTSTRGLPELPAAGWQWAKIKVVNGIVQMLSNYASEIIFAIKDSFIIGPNTFIDMVFNPRFLSKVLYHTFQANRGSGMLTSKPPNFPAYNRNAPYMVSQDADAFSGLGFSLSNQATADANSYRRVWSSMPTNATVERTNPFIMRFKCPSTGDVDISYGCFETSRSYIGSDPTAWILSTEGPDSDYTDPIPWDLYSFASAAVFSQRAVGVSPTTRAMWKTSFVIEQSHLADPYFDRDFINEPSLTTLPPEYIQEREALVEQRFNRLFIRDMPGLDREPGYTVVD